MARHLFLWILIMMQLFDIDQNSVTNRSNKWAVLSVSVLASFLSTMMMSGLNVALPTIQNEFQLSSMMLSLVATSYLLPSAIFLLPSGRLGDIAGRRLIYLIGFLLFALGSLACGLAPSEYWLFAMRALQGMGGAFTMSTGMAILTSVFPPKERGSAIGWNVAAVYIGLSAGPTLGGILTEHFGWRSIFLLNAPLSMLIFLLALIAFKEKWAEARGQRFDLAGSIVYGIGLLLLMLSSSKLPGVTGFLLLATGIVVLSGFVFVQRRSKFPVVDIRLFTHNRVFAFSGLAALINYASTFAVGFLLSLFLQRLHGFSPQYTGLILVAQPLAQALCSPVAGKLSDRIEPRILSSIGMALTALGMAPLIALDTSWPIPMLIVFLVIQGIGFGIFSSPNTNAIMSSVPPRQYGTASGTVATMRMLGMMASMMITAVLFGIKHHGHAAGTENPQDFLLVMHSSFSIFVILCIFGVGFSAVRGNMARNN